MSQSSTNTREAKLEALGYPFWRCLNAVLLELVDAFLLELDNGYGAARRPRTSEFPPRVRLHRHVRRQSMVSKAPATHRAASSASTAAIKRNIQDHQHFSSFTSDLHFGKIDARLAFMG